MTIATQKRMIIVNDFEKLAELLFPDIDKTPADYEDIYPLRNLSEGAKVTRFAPSPTKRILPSFVFHKYKHDGEKYVHFRIKIIYIFQL